MIWQLRPLKFPAYVKLVELSIVRVLPWAILIPGKMGK